MVRHFYQLIILIVTIATIVTTTPVVWMYAARTIEDRAAPAPESAYMTLVKDYQNCVTSSSTSYSDTRKDCSNIRQEIDDWERGK